MKYHSCYDVIKYRKRLDYRDSSVTTLALQDWDYPSLLTWLEIRSAIQKKNLDSLLEADVPGINDLASLQLRWISSVEYSSETVERRWWTGSRLPSPSWSWLQKQARNQRQVTQDFILEYRVNSTYVVIAFGIHDFYCKKYLCFLSGTTKFLESI